MSLDTLQNFYKDAVKIAWTAGAGNFYVTTKPVPTSGYLVINPSSASKREIVRYTGTGTDANGDYITIASVSDRGLGGTTAQTHAVDEPIRMNITAEHWASIQDAIDELGSDLAEAIFAGAAFGSTTTAGIGRASASTDSTIGTATISIATPAVISRTAHGLTVNDRVKFTTDGSLPTGIVAGTDYYVIATGLTADEFQISATLGGTAINTSGSQSGTHTLIKTTPVFVTDTDTRLPTTAEKARIPSVDEDAAMAGGGDFGTPSATNKFITQDYNASASGMPVVRVYDTVSTDIGSSTTQFDITNPAGTTFRYTWDSGGTDPGLSLANNPIGSLINFQAQGFNSANKGFFVVTGAGSNYVEVNNPSGVVESNKTIGTGYITKSGTTGWSKPAGLKYITVEVQAGGGGASGTTYNDNSTAGAGAGGYAKKMIPASSLSSLEYFIIGNNGVGATSNSSTSGKGTAFSFNGNLLYAFGGTKSEGTPGAGGLAYNGDINIPGQNGSYTYRDSNQTSVPNSGGTGGSSVLGFGGPSVNGSNTNGNNGNGYGAGGGGVGQSSGTSRGGDGTKGVIILTEYFS